MRKGKSKLRFLVVLVIVLALIAGVAILIIRKPEKQDINNNASGVESTPMSYEEMTKAADDAYDIIYVETANIKKIAGEAGQTIVDYVKANAETLNQNLLSKGISIDLETMEIIYVKDLHSYKLDITNDM